MMSLSDIKRPYCLILGIIPAKAETHKALGTWISSCEGGKAARKTSSHKVSLWPKSLRHIFYFFLCFLCLTASLKADKNLQPYFMSLKPKEVNVRVGPGHNYPIDWVYVKAGFPVEVIAAFDTWRKIRDNEGTVGWVHQTMLSSKRHALISAPEVLLYPSANVETPPLARLQKGVLVTLLKCPSEWCQVRVGDFKGWVKHRTLWGLYPQEKIE